MTSYKIGTHTAHLIQFPSGRWGFAGQVPAVLAYIRKDGLPLTEKDVDNAAIAGPGIAGLKTRSWATEDEAKRAARAIGQKVTK